MKTDLRDEPAYLLAEGARYLRLAPATLRSWVLGRAYPTATGEGVFPPLIRPSSPEPLLLSFGNLIEAHVLRALRTDHQVSVKDVRRALRYAESELKIKGLLRRKELCTHGGQLFLDRYSELINLSASGQVAIREVLTEHLKRIEWRDHFPVRLYPFVTPADNRSIAIDPRIAFGRPVVLKAGVSTSIIVTRIDAGESEEQIAADYGLTASEVKQAAVYERAA